MLFVKYAQYSEYQLLNQVSLFGVLFLFFRVFMTLERRCTKMPQWLHGIAKFLADHTLEIYLVQYVIIAKLNYGPFPVNWLIVSAAIIMAVAQSNLRYIAKMGLGPAQTLKKLNAEIIHSMRADMFPCSTAFAR